MFANKTFYSFIFLCSSTALALNPVRQECYKASSYNNWNGTSSIKIVAKCEIDFSAGALIAFKGSHTDAPWGVFPGWMDFIKTPNGYEYKPVENQVRKLLPGKSMIINYQSYEVATDIQIFTEQESVTPPTTHFGIFSLNNFTGQEIKVKFVSDEGEKVIDLNSNNFEFKAPTGHYQIDADIVDVGGKLYSITVSPSEVDLNQNQNVKIQFGVKEIQKNDIFYPYLETSAFTDVSQPRPQNWHYSFSKLADLTNAGVKNVTLAFVLSDQHCGAEFFSINYNVQLDIQIKDFLKSGGKIIASFGGANGPYVEDQFTNSSQCNVPGESTEVTLSKVYKKFIDKYGIKNLDFDVEGSYVSNQNQVEVRNKALTLLQADKKYSDVKISYTLPVLPSGLLDNSLWLLRNAVKNGLKINRVNLMTMDYGASFPPDQMGMNAIHAAQSVFSQIKTIFTNASDSELWNKIGITPMIGFNDVRPEEFTLNDAKLVYNFALKQGIGLMSMWSLNRDQPGSQGVVSPINNGEPHTKPYDYSKMFMGQ